MLKTRNTLKLITFLAPNFVFSHAFAMLFLYHTSSRTLLFSILTGSMYNSLKFISNPSL